MKSFATEINERADALYNAREETGNVRLSVELLEAELARQFDYEPAWRLGRALFFLGQETESRAQARAFHARAVKICERAARVCPSQVEGHFWLGVNLALLAALEKPLPALRHALRARRALRRAIALDSAYHAAGPLRVLARLEARLPRWLGGGHTRARAYYEQALALAPANTVTLLYYAELLLAAGDSKNARRQLEALLNAPHDPFWAFEISRDRRLAQAILKKVEVKR
jgi:tetratricopeptide (TPR) repeat protein